MILATTLQVNIPYMDPTGIVPPFYKLENKQKYNTILVRKDTWPFHNGEKWTTFPERLRTCPLPSQSFARTSRCKQLEINLEWPFTKLPIYGLNVGKKIINTHFNHLWGVGSKQFSLDSVRDRHDLTAFWSLIPLMKLSIFGGFPEPGGWPPWK